MQSFYPNDFSIRPWLRSALIGPESGFSVEQINATNEGLRGDWERHQSTTRARLDKVKSRWPALKYCQAGVHAIEHPVAAGELIEWNPADKATATLTQALVRDNPIILQLAILFMQRKLSAAFIGWLKLFAKLVQKEEARAKLEQLLSERKPTFTGPPRAPLKNRPQAQTNAPNIAA